MAPRIKLFVRPSVPSSSHTLCRSIPRLPTAFWYFTIKMNLISFRKVGLRAPKYVDAVIENSVPEHQTANFSSHTARLCSVTTWASPMFSTIRYDSRVLFNNKFSSSLLVSRPMLSSSPRNTTFMNFWWWLFWGKEEKVFVSHPKALIFSSVEQTMLQMKSLLWQGKVFQPFATL